jgi:Ni/Co efflux regulator RcnB
MFKTLSAALIAASMLIAPMAANAAQPAATPAKAKIVATKTVKLAKPHKRHVAKHHARAKFAKHARHHNKFVSHKRYGKLAKAHRHHGKIVKVTRIQKHATPKKVRTSAK